MNYRIIYHPNVKDDIKTLSKSQRDRVKNAIVTRLQTEPEKYGNPLKRSLKGYWKLRVGDIRVVFKILKKEILILSILHRKSIYETAVTRS
jgi:mRNA interferase RelE/StbE